MKRLAIGIVVLLLSVTAFAARAQQAVDSAVCSSEVTAVVAAALKHALVDARDLPDLPIVEVNDSVYVSDYLWGAECVVKDTILPTSGGRAYVLLGRDEARDLANERDGITFAQAGDVKIAEGEASVWVGASLRPADGDERGLLCCCGGQMFLRRDAGEWVFVRWGMRLCA